MNILVTGGAGFIGKHLVNDLVRHRHNVASFDLQYGDDLLKGFSGTFDAIYHLAVLSRPLAQSAPRKAVDVNIKGTINMLEHARKCDAKVIFTSASSVYGIPNHSPVKEDEPHSPVSVYGATKSAAESLILTYNRLYSIDYLIFRFTNVYGLGQKSTREVIPAFINATKKGEAITITGSGKQSRDFVYMDDVVHFLVRALEEDKKNMIFNLGSGKETTINKLIELVATVTGITPEIISRPVELEERWGFGADITCLRDVFGEVPKTSLEEGLKRIWEGME